VTLSQRIAAALALGIPMTARELAAEVGSPVASVRAKLSTMGTSSLVHISGWRRDDDGGRLYPRALWSAGPGPRARPAKPKPLGEAAYGERYRALRRVRVASVWDLATPQNNRRAGGVHR